MLRAAGFAEVLAKPIAVAALRAALARHLPAATVSDGGVARTDRGQALRAVGGNRATADALCELFLRELDDLPRELEQIMQCGDHAALRDRLHRLDASAGFCGAPAVVQATAWLRTAVAGTPWPPAAVAAFLAVCARVRTELDAQRQRPPESEDA
jgi:HPt (histidine-containing phosphotransfer) domain-containing protein